MNPKEKKEELVTTAKYLAEAFPHAFSQLFDEDSRHIKDPFYFESMGIEELEDICSSSDELVRWEQEAIEYSLEHHWEDMMNDEPISIHSDRYLFPSSNVTPIDGWKNFYDYSLEEIAKEKGGIVKFIHVRESFEDNSLPAFVKVEQDTNGVRTVAFVGEIQSITNHAPLNDNEEHALRIGFFDDLLLRFFINPDGSLAPPVWVHASNNLSLIKDSGIDLEKFEWENFNAPKSEEEYPDVICIRG